MAKKVIVKKGVEKIKKEKVKKVVEAKDDLKAIEIKRQKLIDEITPNLLTKRQLKSGGSYIRSKYAREQGYATVLGEINELGAKLSLRPIGLGHLRKD